MIFDIRASTALNWLKQKLKVKKDADVRAIEQAGKNQNKLYNHNNSLQKLMLGAPSGKQFVINDQTKCKLASEIVIMKLSNVFKFFAQLLEWFYKCNVHLINDTTYIYLAKL